MDLSSVTREVREKCTKAMLGRCDKIVDEETRMIQARVYWHIGVSFRLSTPCCSYPTLRMPSTLSVSSEFIP